MYNYNVALLAHYSLINDVLSKLDYVRPYIWNQIYLM